jgi:hypothetical protein
LLLPHPEESSESLLLELFPLHESFVLLSLVLSPLHESFVLLSLVLSPLHESFEPLVVPELLQESSEPSVELESPEQESVTTVTFPVLPSATVVIEPSLVAAPPTRATPPLTGGLMLAELFAVLVTGVVAQSVASKSVAVTGATSSAWSELCSATPAALIEPNRRVNRVSRKSSALKLEPRSSAAPHSKSAISCEDLARAASALSAQARPL